MDIKASVSGKDRRVILDSCVYGEEAAIETYEDVLKDLENLTLNQQMIIQEQLLLIKADYAKVKNLRDLIESKE
jgi:hypothetical protein